MCRPIAVVLCLAAILAPARANISPEPEFGQSLSPRVPNGVAMTAEVVKIVLGRDDVRVEATFDLKNTRDLVVLDVGFPDVVGDFFLLSDRPRDGAPHSKLRDFRASVDGEEVKATYHMVPLEKRRPGPDWSPWTQSGSKERKPSGWMLWPIDFEAGQARRVEVSYRVLYQPTYTPTLFLEGSVGYVLKTGAPWEGLIGRAVVEVRYGEGMSERNLIEASPAGFVRTPEGLAWEWRDFEPAEDVAIRVNRLPGPSEAADFWLAESRKTEEERGQSNAWPLAPEAQAAACLELAERYEECLATCREIVAVEAAARSGGTDPCCVVRVPGEGYRPWELLIVRCLNRLGRLDEAREAARAAIPALAALRGVKPRGILPKPRVFQQWIDQLLTFAAGGPAPE